MSEPLNRFIPDGTRLASVPPMFIKLASGAALTLSLLVTTDAFASESAESPPDAPKPERPGAHHDLLLTAGLGAFTSDDAKTGGAFAVTGLRQIGLLGYGATFEYGGVPLDYSVVTAAPMIGLFLDGPRWARVGIAAVGGVHSYSGVGRGFIASSDPGASGIAPFLGTRLFLGAEAGGKARFHIGIQLSLDDDLTRTRDSYTFRESAFQSPRASTAEHTVGSLRMGGMLALGTAFDL